MIKAGFSALFPTLVYSRPLQAAGAGALNRQMLKEGRQLRENDLAGQRWSAKHYRGGYTSYGSVNRLQRVSPTFETFERRLRRHVQAFVTAAQWDLGRNKLEMTDCWLNIMGREAAHGLHLHPLSTLSGTYYVRVPRGGSGIKFEDPRLERFMAAPPRATGAKEANKLWVTLPAIAGQVVLFESWLRHEVTANASPAERISVSFNYSWF